MIENLLYILEKMFIWGSGLAVAGFFGYMLVWWILALRDNKNERKRKK